MKAIKFGFLAILWIVISFACVGTLSVSAQTTSIELPFSRLEQHAVTNACLSFKVFVTQELNGETKTYGITKEFNNKFAYKAEMDAFFKSRAEKTMLKAMSNSSPDINLDGQFELFAVAGGIVGPNSNLFIWNFFSHLSSFRYRKVDEQYELPDLSGYKMNMARTMAFYMPGINWGIQQYYGEDGNILDWSNSLLEPDPYVGGVDKGYGILYVPTDYILVGSGNPNRLKIIVGIGDNDSYHVFDGTGTEKVDGIIPIHLRQRKVSGTHVVQVGGGDSWRELVLESSTDLKDWKKVRRRVNYYDFSEEPDFEVDVPQTAHIFYRVRGL